MYKYYDNYFSIIDLHPRSLGADKSLTRPTSWCILFDGQNISFDASLVIEIKSTNIPPIMIINRTYETQSSVAVACLLPGRAKDLSTPLYNKIIDEFY
jgi:hypothetical protein